MFRVLAVFAVSVVSFASAYQCYRTRPQSKTNAADFLGHKASGNVYRMPSSLSIAVDSEQAADVRYDKAAWSQGYTSCSSEVCELLASDLKIDLLGTYFR